MLDDDTDNMQASPSANSSVSRLSVVPVFQKTVFDEYDEQYARQKISAEKGMYGTKISLAQVSREAFKTFTGGNVRDDNLQQEFDICAVSMLNAGLLDGTKLHP